MPRENHGPHLWQAKSGIWQIRRFDAGRRILRSTGERDRTRAQALLATVLVELERPALPGEPAVSDILTAYAKAREDTHGHVQLESKCRNVSARIGYLKPAEVTQGQIRGYIQRRQREKAAPGTIRVELSYLRAGLRWAAAEALIGPPRPFSIPIRAKPRDRWLTRAECDRLLAAADQPHMRTFLMLALHTAARSGAIVELPWAAVDLDARIIAYPAKEGGKRRVAVPINDELLVELREARERATSKWVVEWAGSRVKQLRSSWRTTLKRAKIAHCTRHDLRRTAGSHMLQAGVPIEKVAAVLGHSSVVITQAVYAHLAIDHLRSAVAALSVQQPRRPAGIRVTNPGRTGT